MPVGKAEGLPNKGVINCDWLVTLPQTSPVKKAGSLSAAKQRQLDEALRFALGLGLGLDE